VDYLTIFGLFNKGIIGLSKNWSRNLPGWTVENNKVSHLVSAASRSSLEPNTSPIQAYSVTTVLTCPVLFHGAHKYFVIVVVVHGITQAVSSLFLNPGVPGSGPGQVMWDFWWTKWHWDWFSPRISVSPAKSHSTDCSTLIIYHPRLVQ
jgi:hypothetical protein